MFMLFVCIAGLTDEIQELVTKTIRSPPINSGTDYSVFFMTVMQQHSQKNVGNIQVSSEGR